MCKNVQEICKCATLCARNVQMCKNCSTGCANVHTYKHTYLIHTAQILTKRSNRLYKQLPNAGKKYMYKKNTKNKEKKNPMRKKDMFLKVF